MRGGISSVERRIYCNIAQESYDFTSKVLNVTPIHFTSSDHAKIPSFLAICELDMQEEEKTIPARGTEKETRHQGGYAADGQNGRTCEANPERRLVRFTLDCSRNPFHTLEHATSLIRFDKQDRQRSPGSYGTLIFTDQR
jgi:hypothetical protein